MCGDADEAVNIVDDEQSGPEAAAQTLNQFIARVIEAAKSHDDFDADLLAILTNHIVKEDPTDDAVARAAAEIEGLAENRASPPEEEPPDGGDNA